MHVSYSGAMTTESARPRSSITGLKLGQCERKERKRRDKAKGSAHFGETALAIGRFTRDQRQKCSYCSNNINNREVSIVHTENIPDMGADGELLSLLLILMAREQEDRASLVSLVYFFSHRPRAVADRPSRQGTSG